MNEQKEALHGQLRDRAPAVLWKLDGLSEYDVRRPLVPTGTNLLGLVKHLATVEWGHFGAAFGDPLDEHLPWVDDNTEASADMWVAPTETRAAIVGLYERVAARSDAVIERLPLDAVGQVPWWPPGQSRVTLHGILVHTVAEAHRHAGHADILRELIDGASGLGPVGIDAPDRRRRVVAGAVRPPRTRRPRSHLKRTRPVQNGGRARASSYASTSTSRISIPVSGACACARQASTASQDSHRS